MNNIEAFNLAVKEILGVCYEGFPRPVCVNHYSIAEKVSEYFSEFQFDNESSMELHKLCRSTADWLEKADYIWAEHKTAQEFGSVTLTPKAFELLNLIPESLKSSESLGSILIGGVKETSKAGALAAIRVLLSEGVKLAIKSAT